MLMRTWPTTLTLSIFALVLLSASGSPPALADWGLSGAQYSCDQQRHSFELLPYDQSSSDPNPPLNIGFVQITERNPSISCRLGGHTLHAEIDVSPPAARGECMGAGFVRARSVSVNGVELLPDAPAFDFDCPGSNDTLMRFRVVITGGHLSVERCYQSSTPAGRNGCATQRMKIDVVARQRAHELNDLAPPEVQTARSVLKLPPDNDMANVFRSPVVAPGSAPICAHLRPSIGRLGDSIRGLSAVTPTGRISGSSDDERVYIQPANPQVCDARIEPRCAAKSYLIPGDRVDVGYICGAWTYIRYRHRTNATADIFGWVPTHRIYDVDSLITPDPERWKAYWTSVRNKDALFVAIANLDTRRAHELLSDKTRRFDLLEALRIAMYRRDVNMVDALLSRPIDFKANCAKVMDAAMYTSPDVLHALVHAGLDMTCKKDALASVAGSDRLNELNFELSVWGNWAPVRDLPGRAQEFLASGIPVDWTLADGATALFETIGPNNVDVAELLLRNHANPNIVLNSNAAGSSSAGLTALIDAIVEYSSLHDPTMVNLLLDAGANPNYRTAGEYRNDPDDAPGLSDPLAGVTALDVATEAGDFPIVQTLLRHGADPRLRRSDGALPADIARASSHEEVARLIESYATRH